MNIWQILATLMKAIVLMELLLGKEITTPDGASLGIAADVKLDLMRHKIWVMIKHQGQWSMTPGEELLSNVAEVPSSIFFR